MGVPEPLDARHRCELAEGPRWFADALWWVDILGAEVHRWSGSGAVASEAMPDAVSLVLPRRDGGRLLTSGARVELHGDGEPRVLAQLSDDPAMRCNDGTCDPGGN